MNKPLLKRSDLYPFQVDAVSYLNAHPNTMFWGFLGSGKTCISLTSIVDRINVLQVRAVLIACPLRVAHSVWEHEANGWEHTKDLKFSMIIGTKTQRLAGLFAKADIYLINYEAIQWLSQTLLRLYIERGHEIPFNMLICDEISELKNSQSVRMKATSSREIKDINNTFKKVIKKGFTNIIPYFEYTVGLTATPSNRGSHEELFGQYLCIDKGERLGKYVTHFRDNYLHQSKNGWGYELNMGAKEIIEYKISDITLSLNNVHDHISLPPVIYKEMVVRLDDNVRTLYNEFEKEMYAELDSGNELEVFNKVSMTLKLSQIANGCVYTDSESVGDNRPFDILHDKKLDALSEILEESAGSPVLVLYQFRSDAVEMLVKFKKYKPINMSGQPASQTRAIIDNVVDGKCKLLIAHPKSCGFGLDGLQHAVKTVVFMGVGNNLGLYQQSVGRVFRNGQKCVVSVIHILTKDTVDQALLSAIKSKDTSQNALKKALQDFRPKRLGEPPNTEPEPELMSFL